MQRRALVLLLILALAGCGGDSGGPDPEPVGTVAVDVTPDGLGAGWTLSGPDGYGRTGTDDDQIADLVPGSYTLSWDPVDGYVTPPDASGELTDGGTLLLSGRYYAVAVTGTVSIDLEPDDLNAAWVLKVVAGGGEYDLAGRGDRIIPQLPPGHFTVHWEAVPGWTTGSTVHTGAVVAGETAAVDVTYTVLAPWPFATERLEAGAFLMGSPDWEPGHEAAESPQRLVSLTRDILVSVTEITRHQWAAVTGVKQADPTLDNQPMTGVSWYEAVGFCNMMSAADGLEPAYVLYGDPADPDSADWDPDAEGWRLPTEAEWEALCRAGTTTATSAGELHELDCLSDPVLAYFGWTCANADGLQPVRALLPNPLGLYDVHGNVAEWCWDSYVADAYDFLPDVDPVLSDNDIDQRVFRGGNYVAQSRVARSASRSGYLPGWGLPSVGFRPVRNAP